MAKPLPVRPLARASRSASVARRPRRTGPGAVVLLLLAWTGPAFTQAPPSGAATAAAVPLPAEGAANRLLERGKAREALAELDRAAAVHRRAGDALGLARVALARSRARLALGELDEAARQAEKAAAYTGSPAFRLEALTQVGRVATGRSDFARAAAALAEALPIAERTGDDGGRAFVLRALGVLEYRRGRQREASEYQAQALRAADRSGDVSQRVGARAEASATLLGLSRYDAALATAQQGYDIAAKPGVPLALRARALFALALTNAHVWNLDRSAELWTAAIEATTAVNDARNGAAALKQSVETWFALGDFDRASADGQKAAALLEQTGQAQVVAETMARVALSEQRRGRADEARRWADRARAALVDAPESRHHYVHNDLGIVASEIGDLARARADFAHVEQVARKIGDVEYEWRAAWGFGRTALRDDPAAAVAPLERAIATVDRLRQTIPAAALRAGFMMNRVGPYESLVEAHMATASGPADENVRRALEVAERARSRALADLLAEARARLSDPRLAAVRDEETAFGRRFSSVQRRVASAAAPAERDAALQELRQLEHDYETLVVRIRRDNPGYAALAHPRALSATEIGAALAPDEALVEFLMTERRGFAWVVRPDGVRGYAVPGAKALDPQVRLLAALVAAGDDHGLERLGAQLYDSLLKAAEPALRGVRRLVIVPDGVLQRLPFALLRTGDRWLVETYTLSLAPSATILHHLRQPRGAPAPSPLLALAVPAAPAGHEALFDRGTRALGILTHAVGEVDQVRRLVGGAIGSTRVGPDATEHRLKSPDAASHRIVHFAAHAIADEIVPRRSAILLTPQGDDDGLLQVSEIANLSLNADLIVLAACRSHMGRLVRGEGLLSLSRAFIHAGARAVVATSWTVPDRETAWLMGRFYGALRDGLAPDAALQRAQLEALHSGGRRASPSAWAAFVISGHARTPILEARVRSAAWVPILTGVVLVALGAAALLAFGRPRRRARLPDAEASRG